MNVNPFCYRCKKCITKCVCMDNPLLFNLLFPPYLNGKKSVDDLPKSNLEVPNLQIVSSNSPQSRNFVTYRDPPKIVCSRCEKECGNYSSTTQINSEYYCGSCHCQKCKKPRPGTEFIFLCTYCGSY